MLAIGAKASLNAAYINAGQVVNIGKAINLVVVEPEGRPDALVCAAAVQHINDTQADATIVEDLRKGEAQHERRQ